MSHPNEYDPISDGLFADIGAIISAGLESEVATVAPVLQGKGLFYAGRFNGIIAEPSIGKTNICTAACLSSLALDRLVLFIDPEDNAVSATRRLISFGCKEEAAIHGFKHITCPAPDEWGRLADWAARHKPELVILDGCAELLASLDLDENSATDFLKFCRERVKPFTDAGAAVVLSDHVTKSQEGRGRWGRGTGAKLGKFDGVCYSVGIGKPYSPDRAGFVRLKVAKDRNGGIGIINQVVAEIHFTPAGGGKTNVQFRLPVNKEGRFIPTALMEKVSRKLELSPASSLRDLRTLGKCEYVDTAISELTACGYLEVTPGGSGRQTKYSVLKRYREHGGDEQ